MTTTWKMTQKAIRNLLVGSLLLLGIGAMSCSVRRDTPTPARPNDARWQELLSAHTSGVVSKRSRVRIRFAQPVVGPDAVGQAALPAPKIEPATGGKWSWSDRREIVLLSDQALRSGEEYRLWISPQLIGAGEDLGDYEIRFSVQDQAFDVVVAGLLISDSETVTVEGNLRTADVEEAAAVEQMLNAQWLGRSRTITWQHGLEGRGHSFVIDGIERQPAQGELHLTWDGAPIGVSRRGGRDLEVPALGTFEVTQVQPPALGEARLTVRFSEVLRRDQNLRGLVRVGGVEARTQIEGNQLRVFPRSVLTGTHSITLEPGIRSALGSRLSERFERSVTFGTGKPGVRFVGRGVILPAGEHLSIPFEATGVGSVQVTAFRVFESNMGQFLQNNRLAGTEQLGRVGRYLWRKTLELPPADRARWERYELDARELLEAHPGGLFRLTLSIHRGNAAIQCSEADQALPVVPEPPFKNHESLNVTEASGWDGIENWYSAPRAGDWNERNQPCKDGYYRHNENARSQRNFVASNLGLTTKRSQDGRVLVVTTDLRTAQPWPEVDVALYNFQDQQIGRLITDAEGFGRAEVRETPFYLRAQADREVGYLKLSQGLALPTSHFDVGGEMVHGGLKGALYAERGVWRPGDQIHLTLAVDHSSGQMPANHPVRLDFLDPKGQRRASVTPERSLDGFHTFTLETDEKDTTGTWLARARVGGRMFEKRIAIETVVPNRLELDLDFGGREALAVAEGAISGEITGQWLHGAPAPGLKTDVALQLQARRTRLGRFDEFIFDDPARALIGERQVVFEGTLDDTSRATFQLTPPDAKDAAGMLTASFVTRVFEPSGAFSSSRFQLPYHPYERYVGLQLPEGDATRGMLLTDEKHPVKIVTLDWRGEPVSMDGLEVRLYKIGWKWWWDKSRENLARYASANANRIIGRGQISTKGGVGQWDLEIKYPDWGRYLVRVCDPVGGHCTGQVFYADWPGWAGRAQEEREGGGANVLNLTSSQQEYQVGDVATLHLPAVTPAEETEESDAVRGRALLTLETGSRVLEQRWLELDGEEITFEVTAEMSPTVYAGVRVIQPHEGRENDRPLRLYGYLPLAVEDASTRLVPELEVADEIRSQQEISFTVGERRGAAMTYTVAIVDEGLLGLTAFRTPDLHRRFFSKEALGVVTWDLFDEVVGAYGAELERLLALGGDQSGTDKDEAKKTRRFEPVVQFLGPFHLGEGKVDTHQIRLPPYLGAVRFMVVAGHGGAWGSAERKVTVREPLMLLPTLPRVLGPSEVVDVPVTVFVGEAGKVQVRLEPNPAFEILGPPVHDIAADGPGEHLVRFRVKTASTLRPAPFHFSATVGQHQAKAEVEVALRAPNPESVVQRRHRLAPGESLHTTLEPHGLAGSSWASLEVTPIPPLDLGRRLEYLIRYPHGCLEQTTSALFPQLFLPKLVEISSAQLKEIETNVHGGLQRMKRFQLASGAFGYWPGASRPQAWSTNWVGDFLTEARALGYNVPEEMWLDWLDYQQRAAKAWRPSDAEGVLSDGVLSQAYRLYTLAGAGRAAVGEMNRLRQMEDLPDLAHWRLAAAYRKAGVRETSHGLQPKPPHAWPSAAGFHGTFPSPLRDRAMVLQDALTLGREEVIVLLASEISEELAGGVWPNTHALAHALLALSRVAVRTESPDFRFLLTLGEENEREIVPTSPIFLQQIPELPAGLPLQFENPTTTPLHISLVVGGTPAAGEEKAASQGLELAVEYLNLDGEKLDLDQLGTGQDLAVQIRVRNSASQPIENLALSHLVATGFEIHNARLDLGDTGLWNGIDHQDVRDDRVLTYFRLGAGQTRHFQVLLHPAHAGRVYLPAIAVDAMYNRHLLARVPGRWLEIEAGGSQ